MRPDRCIILDTETTGLILPKLMGPEKQPRIIEIGLIKTDCKGTIVAEYSQLINPGELVTAEIEKITGISNKMLEDQPRFRDVLPAIIDHFADCSTLIAHNAPFDTAVLRWDLQRAECQNFPWPPETVCTVQEFRHLFGRNPRLIELYKRTFGRDLEQTHRALDDARALHEVLLERGFWQ